MGDRNIRRSLFEHARGVLSVPNPDLGISYAYALHDEDELRELQANTNPVEFQRPFVFVVDTFLRPVATALPIVMADVPTTTFSPFEMGRRSGGVSECIFHVMGRMRGERDDLGSALARSLDSQVPIYTWTSGSPVLSEYAAIEDDRVVAEEAPMTRDELRQEMSVDYWTMVKFTLITRR